MNYDERYFIKRVHLSSRVDENWGNLIISIRRLFVSYGKISSDNYHLFRIGRSMKLHF